MRNTMPRTPVVSNSVYTDGVWIWSSGLAYYAEQYHILPEPIDFYRHIIANHYDCPRISDEEADQVLEWWRTYNERNG